MRGAKPILLGFLMLCIGFLLTGCAVLTLEGEPTSSLPNLGLLEMEPYRDAETGSTGALSADASYLRVDLWLDGSQVMGGVNPQEESIYPHSGRKFREGGFHYRWSKTVGWYENLLRDMLGAADGSQVRVLRFGNEQLPDGVLTGEGLAQSGATGEELASLRRDLLTYAVDPLPSLFETMSAEDMAGSFYSFATPKLNQLEQFADGDGEELENPGKVPAMSALLEKQIAGLGEGSQRFLADQNRAENDFPLIYALENIDLSRLSVVTFDPAGMRRLSGTDTDGKPMAYLEELLSRRGVFDKGLCAGLYAFRLDYMGEMSSIGCADLSEPLIWGKPIYSDKKREITYVAPMPRTLLTLVIGTPEQVEGYMKKLNGKMDVDTALKGLRGPRDGELTYGQGGETITQQPFAFEYWQTIMERPNAGCYTQHTEGALLTLEEGQGEVKTLNGVQTALLSPGENGKQEDRALALRFPLEQKQRGATLDLSRLQGAQVEVISALLLTDTLPNTADTVRESTKEEQVVPLRDRLYVYSRQEKPFENRDSQSPFALDSIGPSGDGKELVVGIWVKGGKLKEGYYRLRVTADLTDEEVQWLPVDWIDGAASLNVSISNEDIVRWEGFTNLITQRERPKGGVPRNLQHAWGSYTEKLYLGVRIPDCPTVEKAMGLTEMVGQFRAAATAEQSAFVRYVIDVFVDNAGEASLMAAPPREGSR